MTVAMRRRLLLSAACAAFAAPALRRSAASPLHATLHRRHVVGYQGWFICPDEQNRDDWFHWFHRMQDGRLHPTFDMLPDTAEFEDGEGCPTPWTDRAGRPVRLFTAQDARTVRRHVRWMREYEIHCIALQRFVSEIRNPRRRPQRDRVLAHIRAAAEEEGRSLFLMYDTSALNDAALRIMVEDWAELVSADLIRSPAYQWNSGRPVVCIWGLGFAQRRLTVAGVLAAIEDMRRASGGQGLFVVGGVPTFWRSNTRDADPDRDWQKVYAACDMLSPWAVGRFGEAAGADRYLRETLLPDLALAHGRSQPLMPVIFPGFSWANLREAQNLRAPLNQIARRCGEFYWRQAANAINAGATTLYTAMFDEVNEATSIFKAVPTADHHPQGTAFVSLDADGCALPSDWYLQLARRISAGLRDATLPPLFPW
jgi:hypothetical protein